MTEQERTTRVFVLVGVVANVFVWEIVFAIRAIRHMYIGLWFIHGIIAIFALSALIWIAQMLRRRRLLTLATQDDILKKMSPEEEHKMMLSRFEQEFRQTDPEVLVDRLMEFYSNLSFKDLKDHYDEKFRNR